MYRLITQHSIEERILQRAKEKSEVCDIFEIFCIVTLNVNTEIHCVNNYFRFKEW